jgi:hypothetical protein
VIALYRVDVAYALITNQDIKEETGLEGIIGFLFCKRVFF